MKTKIININISSELKQALIKFCDDNNITIDKFITDVFTFGLETLHPNIKIREK